MNLLLRQVTIIDPSSPFHLQQADLSIHQGIIANIDLVLTGSADQEINRAGLHLSPGWVDVFSNFCDPGSEHKETLETGSKAAAAGGYTDVMLLPNTFPSVYTKGAAAYLVQKSRTLPVFLHPIGAITKNVEGKELAEMYDMHHSGAIAYSDGMVTLQSSGILLKALQYVKAIGKTIIQVPDDKSLSSSGLMHEGIVSTQLGLPGTPAIAEEIMVARDIELVRYTDSKIHFTGISTARSVALIRAAKKEGLSVSCSVTPYHLFFCDEDLTGYDTNLKVTPPLRTAADRTALKEGIDDGTVDAIAAHHLPQDGDAKMVEFEYAKSGMIGLQTCFATVRTSLPHLPPERLVELFSTNARRLFGLPSPVLQNGAEASLTLFLPDEEWTFGREQILSKSKNSPFTGKTLRGKPFGIINKGNLFLNE